MPRHARFIILTLLVFASSCSRCGGGTTAAKGALTSHLPRSAEVVLWVPDLGKLGEHLGHFQSLSLASFAAGLQGFPSAEAYVTAVMNQIGVDLRSRESLKKAGFDAERGLGAAQVDETRSFFVVPVQDEQALEKTFATLARQRLGAGVQAGRSDGGVRIVTFSRAQGGTPVMELAFHDRLAWVGTGPVVNDLAHLAALEPKDSIAEEPLFTQAVSRLPPGPDAYAFLRGGSSIIPMGTVQGVTFALRLQPNAVTLNVDAPWPDSTQLKALEKQPGADLLADLPGDSVLVARYQGDPVTLRGVWPEIFGSWITRAIQESGLDFNVEVLGNLKPGLVAGVSLAPNVPMAAGMPTLDIRRTNPFQYVHLVALAEVRDAGKLAATLEKVPKLAQRLGAQMTPAELDGQKVFLTSYRQGEGAHLASVGSKVVLAAPKARLEAALKTLKGGSKGPPALSPEWQKLLDDSTFAWVLDLQKLAAEVKALPMDAWGLGGFAIKATVVRWLEAMSELKAVTLGFKQKDQALEAELSLRLGPK